MVVPRGVEVVGVHLAVLLLGESQPAVDGDGLAHQGAVHLQDAGQLGHRRVLVDRYEDLVEQRLQVVAENSVNKSVSRLRLTLNLH